MSDEFIPKVFNLREEYFNSMMTIKQYGVKILNRLVLPPEKMSFKCGVQKICNYRAETVNGKEIPNYYCDVTYQDVYKEKLIYPYLITFEFTNGDDEKAYLASIDV